MITYLQELDLNQRPLPYEGSRLTADLTLHGLSFFLYRKAAAFLARQSFEIAEGRETHQEIFYCNSCFEHLVFAFWNMPDFKRLAFFPIRKINVNFSSAFVIIAPGHSETSCTVITLSSRLKFIYQLPVRPACPLAVLSLFNKSFIYCCKLASCVEIHV